MTEIIDNMYLAGTVNVDVNWIIGIIGILGTSLGSVAGVLWSFTLSRLKKQDAQINAQNETISNLQADIKRMSRGCGATDCVWRVRE
jgi:hypothetical protein